MTAVHSSTSGRLLVASPDLSDPNFARTVVLMVSHDERGALGLILNRLRSELPPPALAPWIVHGPSPLSLFTGGPVQPEGVIGVMSLPQRDHHDGDLDGLFRPFLTLGHRTLGTIDLSSTVDEFALRGLDDALIRVYSGYSGWSAGQLEHELGQGGWMVASARADDPFISEPWTLWRRVLARQRGSLAWLANYPDDLTAN